ncbi:MAG: CTP synthetase [Epsilonproteobacteria bacterium]|nr:MAG: CTP synthetase [Campylobacterota bacterium]
MNNCKIIFVTGGVLSSLGKGITAASVATILKHSGYNTTMLKIDPYLNVDPGTMSPLEHGEVFVTHDGAETDLDIGHYERFLNTHLNKINNITTGQIYSKVIKKERQGKYLGQTIQVIPHIVDEIKTAIYKASKGFDFMIVELGGTVGDIEGMPFLEAVREIIFEKDRHQTMNIHVTLVPYLKAAGELKTKPTQHSVQELRRIGIRPDMLVCRCEKNLPEELKKKLAFSCDIHIDAVIQAKDAKTIYAVPMEFLDDGIYEPLAKHFKLNNQKPDMKRWSLLVDNLLKPQKSIKLAFVGKYLKLKEAYKSLLEAISHSGAKHSIKVQIVWCDSEDIEKQGVKDILSGCDCILVAGGFGNRGIQGKIEAIKYARTHDIPYLGICLGMQLAYIEYLQNVVGIKDATSVEFDKNTKEPAVYLIEQFINTTGQKQLRTSISPLGGTMRLGSYEFETEKNTKINDAYKTIKKSERHRHRYEVNPAYKDRLEKAGMIISAHNGKLIEAIEIPSHKWFVGVQFHPEFTSTLEYPSPIIDKFIQVSLNGK